MKGWRPIMTETKQKVSDQELMQFLRLYRAMERFNPRTFERVTGIMEGIEIGAACADSKAE